MYDLKCIVIHHKTAQMTLNCAYFDVSREKNKLWNLYQDAKDDKIILYKNGTDIRSIKMRYDEINEGNIRQQIVQESK